MFPTQLLHVSQITDVKMFFKMFLKCLCVIKHVYKTCENMFIKHVKTCFYAFKFFVFFCA